ncbi:hypothetical protein AB4079_02230 [Leifsonia sp. 2MCAF36]
MGPAEFFCVHVLQVLVGDSRILVDHRGDRVRRGRTDRRVQDQVRDRRLEVASTALAGEGIDPVDPLLELRACERVVTDRTVSTTYRVINASAYPAAAITPSAVFAVRVASHTPAKAYCTVCLTPCEVCLRFHR